MRSSTPLTPRITPPLWTLALAFAAFPISFFAADVAGSSDHPRVKRIAGSEIFFHRTSDFELFKVALGKLEWNGAEAKVLPYRSATVEGRLFTNYYVVPEKNRVLEVLRNYEQDFREQNFEILFLGRERQSKLPATTTRSPSRFTG